MTAIQKINTMPSIQEMNQITEMCRVLATSPYYRNMGAGGVLSIWLTAREMGLPPMMCLNGGMYTFSGAVSLSAGLMNYLITSAGHRVEIVELSEEKCTLRFIRGDREAGAGDSMTYTFSKEDAAKAGYLTKKNWREHPRDMMFNRCLSGGARKYMPDAIMGAYIEGEIENKPIEDKEEPKKEMIEISFEESLLFISEGQVVEILELLNKTDQKYRDNFYDLIKRKYGNPTLTLIPVGDFDNIKRYIDQAIKLKTEEAKV